MILFLYGEDVYRSYEELLRLRERFFAKFGADAGRHEFDAEEPEFSFEKFSGACETGGLFSEKKLVILKRPFSALKVDQEKFTKFFQDNANIVENKDIVILVWDTKPDRRLNLFKHLKKIAKQETEFSFLKGYAISRWMQKKLAQIDAEKSIHSTALQILSGEVGSDLYRAENELQKLIAFVGERKNIIEEDVRTCIASSVKEDVFSALDAVGSDNKTRALELMERQLTKGENALYLLTMCAYHVRNMLSVFEQMELGNRDPGNIARAVKIHPFVVKKLLTNVPQNASKKSLKMFQLLGRLDIAAKTGKIDPRVALEMFIVRS